MVVVMMVVLVVVMVVVMVVMVHGGFEMEISMIFLFLAKKMIQHF